MPALLVLLFLPTILLAQNAKPLLAIVEQSCLAKNPMFAKSSDLRLKHNPSTQISLVAVVVEALPNLSNEEVKAKLMQNPCVHQVSENPGTRIAAADPRFAEQAALPTIGYDAGQMYFYHPVLGIKEPSTVAIIDTGTDPSHPELSAVLWRGPQGENGYDFFNDDQDPRDDSGHGTHVAGIIGARTGNGLGIHGVAGRGGLRLMSVKTQGAQGEGSMASLINGIRWATDHFAEVINLSLVSELQNPALEEALQYAIDRNVVVIAASGNQGQQISASNFLSPISYARALGGLIGVGAFDTLTFQRSSFSNYSNEYVELGAPGSAGTSGILSTYMNSGYASGSGTSMAAPHVSGAAALAVSFMKTNGIAYTAAEIESDILSSSIQDASLTGSFQSGRRLNLERLGHNLFLKAHINSSGGFE